MRGIATILLVATSMAFALPSSLLADAQEARIKAKRAQEVIMFGNQQNRASDTNNYVQDIGIKKRAAPVETDEESTTSLPAASITESSVLVNAEPSPRHGSGTLTTADLLEEMRKEANTYNDNSKTIAQYEKGYHYGVGKDALEKHAHNSLLKSDVYGDPATTVNEYRYYGGGDARPTPNKRSASYLSTDAGSRLKRELELDPESLLTLISLWQAQRNNYPNNYANNYANNYPNNYASNYPNYHDRTEWTNSNSRYGTYAYERPEESDVNEGEDEEEDNTNGEWLESPVPMSRYQYQELANQYPAVQPSSNPAHYATMINTYPPSMKRSAYYPTYPRYEQKRAGISGQWGGFTQDKRFMVAKKRQLDRWDEPMLARLLASQPRAEPGMIAHRRVLL